MSQLIFKDSGLLLAEGQTQAEFEADPGYDSAFHQVVDTGQAFETFVMNPGEPTVGWVPTVQKWFYFPSLDQFVQSTSKKHAILAAAETLFSASRWEEILDYIDEQGGFRSMLNRLDLTTARRKIQRARDKGLITVGEVQALAELVQHLP